MGGCRKLKSFHMEDKDQIPTAMEEYSLHWWKELTHPVAIKYSKPHHGDADLTTHTERHWRYDGGKHH